MKHNIGRTTLPAARKTLIAAAVGLALAVGGAIAFAQPAGPHGKHGGGSFDMMIPKMLEQAKASLNLNTQQQAMWDSITAQGKGTREKAWANRQQVKDVLNAELAKPEPDLAAVAAAADSAEQANRAARIAVRNQWLQLYATFSPEQKGIVRNLLQQKLQRMEAFGAKMRERGQNARPAGG